MVKHNDTPLAIARTGRKLHYTASETRTACGAAIRYSVADEAYSNNLPQSWLDLMPLCPRCAEKVER
jgi:hypothetical protein